MSPSPTKTCIAFLYFTNDGLLPRVHQLEELRVVDETVIVNIRLVNNQLKVKQYLISTSFHQVGEPGKKLAVVMSH